MGEQAIDLKALIESGAVKKGGQIIKVPIERPNGGQFNGQTYMIPLEYLYYNDQNGRIGSAISEYESDHGKLQSGHNDEYNHAIQKMVNDSNEKEMKSLVADIARKGQDIPGYVLNDGRVVDGNRRFTAERILAEDDAVTGVQYFETVILDDLSVDDANDQALIKQLELRIQFGQLEKQDYDPIDKAIDAYKTVKINALMTNEAYATYAGMKKSAVEKLISEAELIVEFLKFINANENNYSIAKDMKLDGPLEDMLVEYKRSIKDSPDKDEILGALFTKIIQLRTAEGEGDFKTTFRPLVKNIIGKRQQADYLNQVADSSDSVELALQTDNDGEESEVRSVDDLYGRLNHDEEAVQALVDVDQASNDALDKVLNEQQKAEPIKLATAALNKIDAINTEVVSMIPEESSQKLKSILDAIQEGIDDIKGNMEA